MQRATDDYVKELYKTKEKGKTAPAAEPSNIPAALQGGLTIFPSAYAGDTEIPMSFRTDSDKALQIRSRQTSRIDDVTSYKKMGILGETFDGLLTIKQSDPARKLLQKKIEKLVTEENDDRTLLYDEILSYNKMPKGRMIDLKRSFARSFQSASPAGSWIEDSEGTWLQKK